MIVTTREEREAMRAHDRKIEERKQRVRDEFKRAKQNVDESIMSSLGAIFGSLILGVLFCRYIAPWILAFGVWTILENHKGRGTTYGMSNSVPDWSNETLIFWAVLVVIGFVGNKLLRK